MLSQSQIEQLQAEWQHAQRQVADERVALKKAKQRLRDTLDAQKLIQDVAKSVQQTAHRRIAQIVTRCLQTVYGKDAYKFVIKFEQKRGRTEARLLFVRGDKELVPLKETSGGQAQLAAFALRLASLLLAMPKKRRLLVLDEPLLGIQEDRLPAVRQLLVDLTRELEVQIVLVTHNKAFHAGKVIEI